MVEKGGLDPVFQALYCGAMLPCSGWEMRLKNRSDWL